MRRTFSPATLSASYLSSPMSKVPLALVSIGILLSLFNLRIGPVVWASAPIVVYLSVSLLRHKELGWWSILGVASTAVAILSYFLRVGG